MYFNQITAQKQHAYLLKSQSEICATFDEIPWELTRNCSLISQPGDVLLPEEKWDVVSIFLQLDL